MPIATLSKNNAAHSLMIAYLIEVQGRTKYIDERSTTSKTYS